MAAPRRYRPRSVERRSFLKWAGGKRWLLPHIDARLPELHGRYYEPFVGSGALFFHLRPERATLADRNERLIRSYRGLRDQPEQVIELLQSFPHNRRFFERMRRRDIDAEGDAEVAAWLIYLNRTAFNGLYRVNKSNRFNVPFGAYRRPTICNPALLRACARALRGVSLRVADFAAVAGRARAGDLVYFDPPYVPLSSTSYFTSYTREGFGSADQRRLFEVARRLVGRGVHVMLSNSGTPEVRELYRDGFELLPVRARRNINSRTDRRGFVDELLILGVPAGQE